MRALADAVRDKTYKGGKWKWDSAYTKRFLIEMANYYDEGDTIRKEHKRASVQAALEKLVFENNKNYHKAIELLTKEKTDASLGYLKDIHAARLWSPFGVGSSAAAAGALVGTYARLLSA